MAKREEFEVGEWVRAALWQAKAVRMIARDPEGFAALKREYDDAARRSATDRRPPP